MTSRRAIFLVDDLLQLGTSLRPGKCGANAHCHNRVTVSPVLVGKRELLHRPANGFRNICDLFSFLYASQDNEFFPAIATDRATILLDHFAKGIGDMDQAAVAFLMARVSAASFSSVEVPCALM